MRPKRFERRILLAMLAVVVCCLAGAFGVGYVVVHDAFRMGVNDDVRRALDEAVAARRAHLVALRELGERTADWLANDRLLLEAVRAGDTDAAQARLETGLATHPSIARIELRAGEFVASVRRPVAPDAGRVRELVRARPLEFDARPPAVPDATPMDGDDEEPWDQPGEEGGGQVVVVIAEPEGTFTEFQRTGETADLLRRLARHRTYVSNVYVAVYAGVVGLISLGALVVGALLSRRVTRHLATLTAAVRTVGKGDLGVSVPVGSEDEVGELTRAFNVMVTDLRDQRLRIEHLQRIGGWQDFARRLAHEIKNPLTPIQLAAQELPSSYRGDDPAFARKLADARSIIEEEVATLRRLVTEFSNFARLPEATLVPADLVDVLRDFERSLPMTLEAIVADPASRPVVEVRCRERSLPVHLDAMLFRRALDNLVRNAVQATRDRGGSGVVRVTLTSAGGEALLDVADDGPGVSNEDRTRIFDPYFTTKSDGTGLGLPIVLKVVLEHGGRIELVPGELPGACFRVHLPLSPGTR